MSNNEQPSEQPELASSEHDEHDAEDTEEPFDSHICAKLYNRIIRIGFYGSNRNHHGDCLRKNWFDVWQSHPDVSTSLPGWRDRLPPPIIEFLEQIEVVVGSDGVPPLQDVLAYHLQSVPPPPKLDSPDLQSLHNTGIDDCILLFPSNLFSILHRTGMVMDLSDMRVCYLESYQDWEPDYTQWYSLKDVLERLNDMIELGKYRPIPWSSDLSDPEHPFVHCWEVIPWNDHTLEETVAAYEDLVNVISARLPEDNARSGHHPRNPIATEGTVPSEIKGFPRAFMLRATRPAFRHIAPGLTVYDAASPPPQIQICQPSERREPEFVAPYHRELDRYPALHGAVILFPAADEEFRRQQAGLWIFPQPQWADTISLALPFQLSSYPWSSGRQIPSPTSTRLFQTPVCPFYVHHWTRLVSLLRRWKVLVEEGIWTVGLEGVEGGMEFYRQAEDPEKNEWFTIGEDCFDMPVMDYHIDAEG